MRTALLQSLMLALLVIPIAADPTPTRGTASTSPPLSRLIPGSQNTAGRHEGNRTRTNSGLR